MGDGVDELLPEGLDGERLDRVVAILTGVSRARAGALVDEGAVALDGAAVTQRSRRVRSGERLTLAGSAEDGPEDLAPDPDVPVTVVHEDRHLWIVDKPAGLVVHPGAGHRTGTLVHGLLALDPAIRTVGQPARPGIVHRLDKGTSGLLLVARTPEAYEGLVAALAARRVTRRYLALVRGTPSPPRGMVDAPLGRSPRDPTRVAVVHDGREARTEYETVTAYREPVPAALLRCRLHTGRTHQIRVHLAAIGHPVVGDDRYGGDRPGLPAPRPCLHAAELALDHPVTGEPVHAASPLPPDLEAVLASLR